MDLTTIFGSKAAPADFDCVAATLGELAKTISRLPKAAYHRTLDDMTVVCPQGCGAGKKFVKAYRRICKFINVELAQEDLAKEKAFCNSTTGTVLGGIDRYGCRVLEATAEAKSSLRRTY